jgi:hypothetical protein
MPNIHKAKASVEKDAHYNYNETLEENQAT